MNRIVEGVDIFMIPAMNPDGINYSHHDEKNWRKNRNQNANVPSSQSKGVDNNRNYSAYWGEAGSDADPESDSYRGISPLSEPENRNVAYVLDQFPNIITAVDCHSFGEDIFRPNPTGGLFISSQPVTEADHEVYLKLESSMNSAISLVSPGKEYDTTKGINNHSGTSDDYLYIDRHIFGFCLECVSDDFWPDIKDAVTTTKEVAAALKVLADQTRTLKVTVSKP